MFRHVIGLVLVGICGVGSVQAGVFQDIFRGLDLLATPSGSTVATTSDGTRVNGARVGRLRVERTGLGRGWELQFDRSFGVDSSGRSETLNLGGIGDISLQGSTQATLGYSGKKFRSITASVNVDDLDYLFRSRVGVQDAELLGTLDYTLAMQVNPLGFYDLVLSASNTNSQFALDGVIIRDEQDTNFDIGPISISGNVFYDGALSLLTMFGVDTTELESAFPQSPVDQINEAIRAELQELNLVAGESVEAELTASMLEALLDPESGVVSDLFDEATETLINGDTSESEAALVPEPSTLLLALLGGVAFWRSQRRH